MVTSNLNSIWILFKICLVYSTQNFQNTCYDQQFMQDKACYTIDNQMPPGDQLVMEVVYNGGQGGSKDDCVISSADKAYNSQNRPQIQDLCIQVITDTNDRSSWVAVIRGNITTQRYKTSQICYTDDINNRISIPASSHYSGITNWYGKYQECFESCQNHELQILGGNRLYCCTHTNYDLDVFNAKCERLEFTDEGAFNTRGQEVDVGDEKSWFDVIYQHSQMWKSQDVDIQGETEIQFDCTNGPNNVCCYNNCSNYEFPKNFYRIPTTAKYFGNFFYGSEINKDYLPQVEYVAPDWQYTPPAFSHGLVSSLSFNFEAPSSFRHIYIDEVIENAENFKNQIQQYLTSMGQTDRDYAVINGYLQFSENQLNVFQDKLTMVTYYLVVNQEYPIFVAQQNYKAYCLYRPPTECFNPGECKLAISQGQLEENKRFRGFYAGEITACEVTDVFTKLVEPQSFLHNPDKVDNISNLPIDNFFDICNINRPTSIDCDIYDEGTQTKAIESMIRFKNTSNNVGVYVGRSKHVSSYYLICTFQHDEQSFTRQSEVFTISVGCDNSSITLNEDFEWIQSVSVKIGSRKHQAFILPKDYFQNDNSGCPELEISNVYGYQSEGQMSDILIPMNSLETQDSLIVYIEQPGFGKNINFNFDTRYKGLGNGNSLQWISRQYDMVQEDCNPVYAVIEPSSPEPRQELISGQDQVFFSLEYFQVQDHNESCGEIEYSLKSEIGSERLPYGFNINSIVFEDHIIKIIPIDQLSVTTYTFYVEAQVPGNETAIAGPFELMIKESLNNSSSNWFPNIAPFFQDQIDVLRFKLSQNQTEYSVQLPSIMDDYGQFQSINLSSQALGYVFYAVGNKTEKEGSIDYDPTENTVKILVSDNFNATQIDGSEIEIVLKNNYDLENKLKIKVELDQLIEKILVENETIIVWVPTYQPAIEVTEDTTIEKVENDHKLKLDIASVSNIGITTLEFSESIIIDESAKMIFKQTGNWSHYLNSSVMQIHVQRKQLKSDVEDESMDAPKEPDLRLNWTVASLESSKMVINLDFYQPLDISSQGFTDELVVNILNFEVNSHGLFKTIDGLQLSKNSETLLFPLGPQSPRTLTTVSITAVTETSEKFLKGTLLLSVFLNYMKVTAISQAFKSLRVISLVIHLPLVGVFLPGIATIIFSTFFSMATYDVIEADGIIESTFKFDEEGREKINEEIPVPENIAELEYENRNALILLATLGIIMIIFLIEILSLPFLYLIQKLTKSHQVCHGLFKEKRKKLFFGETITFAFEGYFELLIIALLSSKGSLVTTSGEVISSILMVMCFAMSIMLTIFSAWVIFQDEEYLKSDEFKNVFGNILKDLKLGSRSFKKHHLGFLLVYILQRCILLFVCFKESLSPGLRAQLFIFINHFLTMYFFNYRPFDGKIQNDLHCFNEMMVNFSAHHIILFTGVTNDSNQLETCAMSFAIVFLTLVVPNVILNVLWMAKLLFKYIRGDIFRYRAKKTMKYFGMFQSSDVSTQIQESESEKSSSCEEELEIFEDKNAAKSDSKVLSKKKVKIDGGKLKKDRKSKEVEIKTKKKIKKKKLPEQNINKKAENIVNPNQIQLKTKNLKPTLKPTPSKVLKTKKHASTAQIQHPEQTQSQTVQLKPQILQRGTFSKANLPEKTKDYKRLHDFSHQQIQQYLQSDAYANHLQEVLDQARKNLKQIKRDIAKSKSKPKNLSRIWEKTIEDEVIPKRQTNIKKKGSKSYDKGLKKV